MDGPRRGAVEAESVPSSHEPWRAWILTGPSAFNATTHNRRVALLTETPGGSVDKSKRRKAWRSPPVPELRMKIEVLPPLTCPGVARLIFVSAEACTVSPYMGPTQRTGASATQAVMIHPVVFDFMVLSFR